MPWSALRTRLFLDGWRFWAALALLAYALLGFLLVPWLVEREIEKFGATGLGRTLSVERVRFNPFALSLGVEGVRLDEQDGTPLAAVGAAYVNFEVSSLLRHAFTFSELEITAPYVNLVRFPDGSNNLARLAAAPDSGAPEEPAADDGSGLPRVIVHEFRLEAGALDLTDRSRPTEFRTRIEPIDLELSDFNTLPNEAGEHSFRVVTETGADITWTGHVQANPPGLKGHVAANGERPRLLWRYFQDQVAFEIADGRVTLSLDLDVTTTLDGPHVDVANLSYSLEDLLIKPKGSDEQVLSIPKLELTGGRLEWPEQTLHLDDAHVTGARLRVGRDASGNVNLQSLLRPGATAVTEPPTETSETPVGTTGETATWRFTLDRLAVDDLGVAIEDLSWREPLRTGIEHLNLTLTRFSTEPGAQFGLEIAADVSSGGRLTAAGDVGLNPQAAALEIGVDALSLAPLDAVVSNAANLRLRSGTLALSGRLRSDADEPLAFSGESRIDELVTEDSILGERFVAWRSLTLPSFELALGAGTLEVASAAFDAPYGKLTIKPDGSTSLSDVLAPTVAAGDVVEAAETSMPEPADGPASRPLAIDIGEVTFAEGSANFADLSLPLPFATAISSLTGRVENIRTDDDALATVTAAGTVDESGRVDIEGELDPFAPGRQLDMDVRFNDVHMPRLTPYSRKFAGREISGGKLSLDLNYRIDGGRLDSENRIVIDRLKLGAKVESPDAMDLPLDLAVALLQDGNGRIDLDIPVRGDVNDPSFEYGAIVRKTLGNLLVQAVSAPFKLLGALLPGGRGEQQLEFVEFEPGEAELSEGERADLDAVAAAIAKRPQLVLKVAGPYSAATDRTALQNARLAEKVTARVASIRAPDIATAERAALEALYATEFSETELDNLAAANTRSEDGGAPSLDVSAYVTGLRRRLAENEPVSTAELEALADARSRAVVDYLTTAAGTPGQQLVHGDTTTVEPDADGRVALQLEVTSGKAGS